MAEAIPGPIPTKTRSTIMCWWKHRGYTKEDIQVYATESSVTVAGEGKPDAIGEHAAYHRKERVFGKFPRAFKFAGAIDSNAVTAEIKQGTLSVTLPKQKVKKIKRIINRHKKGGGSAFLPDFQQSFT